MEKSNILITITAGLLISTSITTMTMTMAMEKDEGDVYGTSVNSGRVAIPNDTIGGVQSLTESVMNVGDDFRNLFQDGMQGEQSEVSLSKYFLGTKLVNSNNPVLGWRDLATAINNRKMSNREKAKFFFRTFLTIAALDEDYEKDIYSDSPKIFTGAWDHIASQIISIGFYGDFSKICQIISDSNKNFKKYSKLLLNSTKKLVANANYDEEELVERVNNRLLKYIVSLDSVVDDREQTENQKLVSEFTDLKVDGDKKSDAEDSPIIAARKRLKKTKNKYEDKVKAAQAALDLRNNSIYKVVTAQMSAVLKRTLEKLEQADLEVVTELKGKAKNTAEISKVAETVKRYLNEYCGAHETNRESIAQKYQLELDKLRINAAIKASSDNRGAINEEFNNSPTNSVMPMEFAAEKDPAIQIKIAALDVIIKLINQLNACTKEQRNSYTSALSDSFEKAFEDAIARTHSSKARMKNQVKTELNMHFKMLVEAGILPEPKKLDAKGVKQQIEVDEKTAKWKTEIGEKVVNLVRNYLKSDTFRRKELKEQIISQTNKIKKSVGLGPKDDLSASGIKSLPSVKRQQDAIARSVALKAIQVGFALENHLEIVKEAVGLKKSAAELKAAKDEENNTGILAEIERGVALKKVDKTVKQTGVSPDVPPKQAEK